MVDSFKSIYDYGFRAKIDTFINDVFNRYNGTINICNPAVLLDINWTIRSGTIMGTSNNPNIVMLYPSIMIKYSTCEEDLLWCIITTIIHELYHIDQIIDYDRLLIDRIYHDQIECAAERMALEYCIFHMNEICEVYHLPSKLVNFVSALKNYRDSHIYQRKTYNDHIISICMEMVESNEYIDAIRLALADSNWSLIMLINKEYICIKDKTYHEDLAVVNKFIYNYALRFDLRCIRSGVDMDEVNRTCIIDININGQYDLCRLRRD